MNVFCIFFLLKCILMNLDVFLEINKVGIREIRNWKKFLCNFCSDV